MNNQINEKNTVLKENKEESYFYNSETDEINIVNLFFVIFLVVLAILIISYLGSGSSETSTYGENASNSTGSNLLFWIFIIFISFSALFVYIYLTYYDITFDAYVSNFFGNGAKIDVKIDDKNKNKNNNEIAKQPIPSVAYRKKEVFNIPANNYTYDEARALCKAYDSTLATYKQVEDAYENGGEWCKYGWSEDQLALFPTQEGTYKNLQKIKGHEYDCGRPGVNGGYFEDKEMKFGVNCYGYKPNISEQEAENMNIMSPYPETKEEAEFQKKVENMKQNVDNILLSPFNYTNWNQA